MRTFGKEKTKTPFQNYILIPLSIANKCSSKITRTKCGQIRIQKPMGFRESRQKQPDPTRKMGSIVRSIFDLALYPNLKPHIGLEILELSLALSEKIHKDANFPSYVFW